MTDWIRDDWTCSRQTDRQTDRQRKSSSDNSQEINRTSGRICQRRRRCGNWDVSRAIIDTTFWTLEKTRVGKNWKKIRKNGEANVPSGRPTQNYCATKQNWNKITKQKCVETKTWFHVVSRHTRNLARSSQRPDQVLSCTGPGNKDAPKRVASPISTLLKDWTNWSETASSRWDINSHFTGLLLLLLLLL